MLSDSRIDLTGKSGVPGLTDRRQHNALIKGRYAMRRCRTLFTIPVSKDGAFVFVLTGVRTLRGQRCRDGSEDATGLEVSSHRYAAPCGSPRAARR